jgi:hypothetical protein
MEETRNRCGKCGRQFSEADLWPLTDQEIAICIKENIDPTNWVKVRCPRCGQEVLRPVPDGMEAPQPHRGRMGRVSVNGREYVLMSSADQLGRSIARRQAAALITTWDKVGRQHVAVMKAAVAAGAPTEMVREALNPADRVVVGCTSCHRVASSQGLHYLILLTGPTRYEQFTGFGAGIEQLRTMQDGHCPRCGNGECYYIVDTSGFSTAAPPTS